MTEKHFGNVLREARQADDGRGRLACRVLQIVHLAA